MFDHVTIRVASREASEAFYRTLLATLEVAPSYSDEAFVEWCDFTLVQEADEKRATTGLHLGFVAPSRAHVDEFWRLGRALGYEDAGAPGERHGYKPDYHGAFLLDPDS